MADATVAARLRGGSFSEPHSRPGGAALDDLFDDPVLRSAMGRAAGMRPLSPCVVQHLVAEVHAAAGPNAAEPALNGLFERRRLGLRRWEWGPYGLYAPVCADPQRAEALAQFLNLAPGRASQARLQLNPLCPEAGRLAEQAAAQGWRVLPRETHLLDLRSGLEALRRGYHATKRNQIAKPVKVDSRIALARTEADLQPYFEVYDRSLQRWGRAGAWPYPRQLFLDLLHSPAARIWTHHVQGRLACAVVMLESRHQALYWQGVSRIDEDQKRAHPMARLMDAVIQDLCARGVPVLNLGASEGLPQVRRFKEEFGARPAAYSTLQWESAAWRWLRGARAWRLRSG
jgi:hypothetical protein